MNKIAEHICKIRFREDTAENFSQVNPILSSAEPAVEIDTGRMKVGDGKLAWNDLPYMDKTGPQGERGVGVNNISLGFESEDEKSTVYSIEFTMDDGEVYKTELTIPNGKSYVTTHYKLPVNISTNDYEEGIYKVGGITYTHKVAKELSNEGAEALIYILKLLPLADIHISYISYEDIFKTYNISFNKDSLVFSHSGRGINFKDECGTFFFDFDNLQNTYKFEYYSFSNTLTFSEALDVAITEYK